LSLNRRKFAKNPTDLIRRKFSIDGGLARKIANAKSATISKPYLARFGNLAFTICIE
jgi:hypothetical protein